MNPTGTPWLATAGTGDVLSGLAGALLAQGLLPPQAASRPRTCTGWPGWRRRAAAAPRRQRRGDASADRRLATVVRRAAAPRSRSAVTRVPGKLLASHRRRVVDLGAITGNIAALCERVAPAAVMAVVKANGYGHGAVPAARAALRGGADWLGVVHVAEALEVRRAGVDVPLLCLMAIGSDDHAAAITAGRGPGGGLGRAWCGGWPPPPGRRPPGPLHLKADTGLSRGGATPADWPAVLAAAWRRRRDGASSTGLWSHFASADGPGNPSIAAQLAAFAEAWRVAEKAGHHPEVRHIANTAAALDVPEARYDLVRVGGGCYGLSTLPGGRAAWLRPAMTLRARLALVKRVPAGTGVSYGHRYVTTRETTLGLVPLGYADGMPRLRDRPAAGGRARPPLADRGHCLHGPVRRRLRRRAGGGGGRGRAVRPGGRRGADGPGVGRGARHDFLRDRDRHRRARAADAP